jgi:HPt (histidine-containing phosphotransfer) domain-containing protein
VSSPDDARPAIQSGAPVFHPPAIELLRRLGGDKLVRDVIDIFTRNAPPLLTAARAGAEAGDGDAVRRALHALKSSAGQLGAARMQQLCGEGEVLAGQGAGPELTRLVLGMDAEFAAARVHLERVRPQAASALTNAGIAPTPERP